MLKTTLLAATAFGLLATTQVMAQDYDNDTAETVTVTAPRLPTPDHSSMAPTAYTHLSVQVSYHDLDLRTRSGARELRARIRDAAAGVCEELQHRFPIGMVDNPPCYKTAVGAAMARADNAISDARNYSEASYSYDNDDEE